MRASGRERAALHDVACRNRNAKVTAWQAPRDSDPKLLRAAALVEAAVEAVLGDPAKRTRDIGGQSGTDAFTDAVCEAVRGAAAAARAA